MAAAAVAQLMGGSPAQIEYAAEMAQEQQLGLTCDPIGGLVQIPCIERNAYAAARAMDAGIYALYTAGLHRVSFDQVVRVMKETGKDLPPIYRETSVGGLANAREEHRKNTFHKKAGPSKRIPPKRKFELCVLKNVPSQELCKYSNIYPPPYIILGANSITFVGFLVILP